MHVIKLLFLHLYFPYFTTSPKPFDKKTTKRTFNLLQHGVKWEQTFLGFFLVPYRRKPKGTIVLGSVRLPVRHIKILSCPDFFLTSFDILT
jgi:hypothetical protein